MYDEADNSASGVKKETTSPSRIKQFEKKYRRPFDERSVWAYLFRICPFILEIEMKKQHFTIYEICLMAFLAVLGMFIKPLVSPVFNLLTDFIRIPGGSVTAGFSMLFIVFGAAYVQKKGTGALMGLVQAVISLTTGISATAGILVFITYTLPGIAIDIVLCSGIAARLPVQQRMSLAGAMGVLAGAAFTNMLYFHLSVIPFILFYIFGILSGALGGYIAYEIIERIPQSMKTKR